MTPVTADACAWALIAAARAYGDDPIEAVEARPGLRVRRSVAPAAWALAAGLRITGVRAGRILGVNPETMKSARGRAGDSYTRAYMEALRAVRAHLGAEDQHKEALGSPAEIYASEHPILGVLRVLGALSAPDLASVMDLPESAIRSDLLELERLGFVKPDDVPLGGMRYRAWMCLDKAAEVGA